MNQEWTPERTSALIALWDEGVAASEIGRRLAITKNAVIGKSHRLGLSRRNVAASRPRDKDESKVIRLAGLGAGMCSWPEGDPGTPGLRFCGDPVVPEKPYCAHHCDLAYVRVTKERKDVVAA